MTAKKRDKILDYAYRLENRGDIPLNQISNEVKKGLEQPIRYGVVTRRYIDSVLPPRFKNGHRSHKGKQESLLERRNNVLRKQEMDIRWKRLTAVEQEEILEIIREMQKKE